LSVARSVPKVLELRPYVVIKLQYYSIRQLLAQVLWDRASREPPKFFTWIFKRGLPPRTRGKVWLSSVRWSSCNEDKSSAVAEMAAQCCTSWIVKIWGLVTFRGN